MQKARNFWADHALSQAKIRTIARISSRNMSEALWDLPPESYQNVSRETFLSD
jgi:hypothetical protein